MNLFRIISYDFVLRYFPVLIIYVRLPKNIAGMSLGPIILIKPKYRKDLGLLEHEKTHAKHAYIGLIVIHSLLYLLSKRFRYWAALQCYRVQLTYAEPSKMDYLSKKFARFIVNDYRLDVTFTQALSDLIE